MHDVTISKLKQPKQMQESIQNATSASLEKANTRTSSANSAYRVIIDIATENAVLCTWV